MSNLRQIGLALIAYATDHNGSFPAPACVGDRMSEDWVHWQPGRDLSQSRIRRYLNGDLGVLKCPGGVEERKPPGSTVYPPYPFSYSVNNRITGSDAGTVFLGGRVRSCRLSQIVDPSMKILAIEEDTTGINDGEWGAGGVEQYLSRPSSVSVIHDQGRERSFGDLADRDRYSGRGNVVFADGRCEFFPRRKVGYATYSDPHNHHNGPY
jgi:prepilin-type processing-associated H-X9-DG protein